MTKQEQKVRKYFDSIASTYRKRYDPTSSAYHAYFFNERLQAAVEGFDFENKSILDIGAGTGALYDYLKKSVHSFDYYACDISIKMLAQSKIPTEYRQNKPAIEIEFQDRYFDYIFMLGVSSYMEKCDMEKHVRLMEERLKHGGKAIISFTHRHSLDNFLRFGFRNVLKPFISRDKIMGRSFSIRAYSLEEIRHLLNLSIFEISNYQWLNHTFSPFNQIFPRFSVAIAHLIKKCLSRTFIIPFLSADFILVFSKKDD